MLDLKQQKIAIFGGTFDPPHLAHVAIAKAVIDRQLADRVMFIPAAVPPHKLDKTITPFDQRYQMLTLLLEDYEPFIISDIEQQRIPKPSYTLDTIQTLQERYPHAEFAMLIGSDSLAQLHTWYQAELLVQQCELIVYPRPDIEISVAALEKFWNQATVKGFLKQVIDVPLLDISSTEIRKKVKNNENLDNLLDKRVINYIKENHLYKQGDSN